MNNIIVQQTENMGVIYLKITPSAETYPEPLIMCMGSMSPNK